MSLLDELVELLDKYAEYREIWIQQYWWLVIGEDRSQEIHTAEVHRTPTRWPPFWGHVVPLGGDM